MIQFACPAAFLFLVLPFIIRALLPAVKGLHGDALRVPFLKDLQKISKESGEAGFGFAASSGYKPAVWLLFLTYALLVTAAARPQWAGEPFRLKNESRDILLVMVGCDDAWRALLLDALQLVRNVLAADVKDEPLPPWRLGGMDAEEVHRGSHHPEAFGLSGHLLPAPEQGLLAAQMNRLRAMCRETELAAIAAWQDGVALRHEDCVLALNRLSSYFYLLQLRAATGA